MCQKCDDAFNYAAQSFENVLIGYRDDLANGRCYDTPAKRVREMARMFMEDSHGGRLNAWYVAVAIERLMALEMSGIPT
jgi:hypothetical protein